MSKTSRQNLKSTVRDVAAGKSIKRMQKAPKKPVYVFKGRFQ